MKHKGRIITLSLLIAIVVLALIPAGTPQPIKYIDRQDGKIKTEQVVAGQALNWLYSNPLGELTTWTLVKRKFVSQVYGYLMDTKWSARKVSPFIKKYHIKINECQRQDYYSFNDFFTRKIKPDARKIDTNQNTVVSPGDGKMLAYADVSKQDFIVKGYRFQLKSFLQNDSLAALYRHGSLLLLRLCPTDYHRYHFPVSGNVSPLKKIPGDYYSVSPLAIKQRIKIFCENKRQYDIITTKNFGPVLMAEIGATMVGSMIQTFTGNTAIKGEEKGYFKFGGSSIILIFKKGKITIDPDLIENTKNHLETAVHLGDRIAVIQKKGN